MTTFSEGVFSGFLEKTKEKTDYHKAVSVNRPVLRVVVGQQGSGKTTAIKRIAPKHPNSVIIIPDNILFSHSDYGKIRTSEGKKRIFSHTGKAIDSIIEKSFSERKNIVLENAWIDNLLHATLREAKLRGYERHLIHINEYLIICELCSKTRYIEMLGKEKYPRYVDNAWIEESFGNNKNLLVMQREGLIDSYFGYEHNYQGQGRGTFLLNNNSLEENLAKFSEKNPSLLSEGHKRFIKEQVKLIEQYIKEEKRYKNYKDIRRWSVIEDYETTYNRIKQHYNHNRNIKINNDRFLSL